MYICVCVHLVFFLSIIPLYHLFFIPLLALFTHCSNQGCNHVQGLQWEERGGSHWWWWWWWAGSYKENVGKRKKKAFVCVPNYHSSQPKVTFEENGRTCSQNSYLHSASSVCVYVCECWLQWWWGRLNNVMAFLLSMSSGLITHVSSLCVIVVTCVNEYLCPVSDCTSWLSSCPADFNSGLCLLIGDWRWGALLLFSYFCEV